MLEMAEIRKRGSSAWRFEDSRLAVLLTFEMCAAGRGGRWNAGSRDAAMTARGKDTITHGAKRRYGALLRLWCDV